MLRSAALWAVAYELPAEARERKLALLARAADQAKAANSPVRVVMAARSMQKLGEKEKARALVAEYVGSGTINPQERVVFGSLLAHVDPGSAVRIASELAPFAREDANEILWNVAVALAEDDPTEAERVLRLVPQRVGAMWMEPAVAWKIARRDPARAQRLVEESQRYDDSPRINFYLACGLKARDPASTEAEFWKGIRRMDQLLEQGADSLADRVKGGAAALMPVVEQIDPSLVPEVFWRASAARPPADNPGSPDDPYYLRELVPLPSWYDREAAAVVHEDGGTLAKQLGDTEPATWRIRILGRLPFDPRGAVAALEQVRATTDPEAKAVLTLRENVATSLARSYEDQWLTIWFSYGYGQLKAPLDRDIR
jgi:hypothetical protein